MIDELLSAFNSPHHTPKLMRKDLEKKAGFLMHLAMTFRHMKPFLKGIFLTMNSWHKGRDKYGWKIFRRAFLEFFKAFSWHSVDSTQPEDNCCPVEVTAVKMLYSQLSALKVMFASALPPLCLICGADHLEVVYVFGDASGSGFGSSWLNLDSHSADNILKFRFGV